MHQHKKDFFRDTSVRYLGYANEIGESLRPVVKGKIVNYSYGIAIGYVLADTVDKSLSKLWNDGRPTKVVWAAGDALLWQGLASIVLPGLAINRIVRYSDPLISKYLPKLPVHQRTWMTVGIGLASIPIIVRPIDAFVHLLMTITYRQIFK